MDYSWPVEEGYAGLLPVNSRWSAPKGGLGELETDRSSQGPFGGRC